MKTHDTPTKRRRGSSSAGQPPLFVMSEAGPQTAQIRGEDEISQTTQITPEPKTPEPRKTTKPNDIGVIKKMMAEIFDGGIPMDEDSDGSSRNFYNGSREKLFRFLMIPFELEKVYFLLHHCF